MGREDLRALRMRRGLGYKGWGRVSRKLRYIYYRRRMACIASGGFFARKSCPLASEVESVLDLLEKDIRIAANHQ